MLLGRVVAHELYHLLVKTHDHAVSGLRAAEMSPNTAARPEPLAACRAYVFYKQEGDLEEFASYVERLTRAGSNSLFTGQEAL